MSLSFSRSVWKRERVHGVETMSRGAYSGAVTGFTVYGLVLASVLAFLTMKWHPSLLTVLLLGLGLPLTGILIALFSKKWPWSLLGYTMVIVGLGAITGPTVAMYKTGVVIMALGATCGVTIVMSLVGILYPRSLESWAGYLFAALLGLVFVRFGQAVMAGMGVSEKIWYMPIIEYASAALFSAYIVFDWNRALRLQHTLDNAVDCALAIFLDVLNLFLNLLRIFGGTGIDNSSDD